MTTYTIAAELLQELRDYLQRQCGQRCNAEYNPCEAQELDEGLRTLQPNTQEAVGWLIDGLDVVMSHTHAQAEQAEHHAMGGTAVAYPIYTHPAHRVKP